MDLPVARRIGLSLAALVTTAHIMLLVAAWLLVFGRMAMATGPESAGRASDWRTCGLDLALTCARGYAFGTSPCSWEAVVPRALTAKAAP